jgi:ABC-type branched-subunit amino acid transport system ATPase component
MSHTDVDAKQIGDVILDVKNISLRFGGVNALTDISFNVREHEVRAIIGPNGAGKSSMLNCINGVYTPSEGSISFRGQTFDHMDSRQVAEMGIARTFQKLSLVQGHERDRQHHDGTQPAHQKQLVHAGLAHWPRAARRRRAPRIC